MESSIASFARSPTLDRMLSLHMDALSCYVRKLTEYEISTKTQETTPSTTRIPIGLTTISIFWQAAGSGCFSSNDAMSPIAEKTISLLVGPKHPRTGRRLHTVTKTEDGGPRFHWQPVPSAGRQHGQKHRQVHSTASSSQRHWCACASCLATTSARVPVQHTPPLRLHSHVLLG